MNSVDVVKSGIRWGAFW